MNLLLVTHGSIGKEMVASLHSILKIDPKIDVVSVFPNDSPDSISAKIQHIIEEKRRHSGWLILTALYCCTLFNQCLPFLDKADVEIIAGVNFPILMKLATMKDELSLTELVQFIKTYGQKNIVSAKEVVKRN